MARAGDTDVILKSLRQEGVQLAVDDFGTWYSSLSYLRRFPVTSIKIDQSFVREISETPRHASLVTAIIGMGRGLGLRVVAEGVETAERLAVVREQGCDEAQGYYLGRPV